MIFISEAVTFFGNQERDRNVYTIPGLDYVAHEDVIPYMVIKSVLLKINKEFFFLSKLNRVECYGRFNPNALG
mgnify:FL=1